MMPEKERVDLAGGIGMGNGLPANRGGSTAFVPTDRPRRDQHVHRADGKRRILTDCGGFAHINRHSDVYVTRPARLKQHRLHRRTRLFSSCPGLAHLWHRHFNQHHQRNEQI
jgi:hypothetical protein